MKKKLVLIAEDEEAYNFLLKNQLLRAGFEVVTTYDGEEALAAARVRPPDIVLLDLVMPIKDGFITLSELRQDPRLRDVPVIILSNLNQCDDVGALLQLDVKHYLVKSNLKLSDAVQKVCDVLGL